MTRLYRSFATVEEMDDQYQVARSIKTGRDYPALFAAESARALERLRPALDVRYGLTRDEYLDIFAPAPGGGMRPVFVFIHGGYWRAFATRDFAFAAAGPVANGMVTVVPNYTLAPLASLAEIVRQMRAAVVWVQANIARYGGDPSRIVVGGHSAGGHLAAMAALTDWDRYDLAANPVHAVHAVSGVFDLRPLPYTYLAPSLQLSLHEVTQLSPMLHDLPTRLPPFIMSYGGAESAEFQRQSEDFAARLTGAGHAAAALKLPGENHMDAVLGLADPHSPLTRAVAAAAA